MKSPAFGCPKAATDRTVAHAVSSIHCGHYGRRGTDGDVLVGMIVEFVAVVLAFVVLCATAGLGVAAVRRSTAAERSPAPPAPYGHRPRASAYGPPRPPYGPPGPPYGPPGPPYGPPGRPARTAGPRSARGLWVGAATTGTFGFALLVVAVGSLLLSLSGGTQMIVTPERAGGMERHDDPRLRGSLDRQRKHMRDAGVPHPTVAFYREAEMTTSNVAFAGGWGRIPDPGGNLRDLLRSMGGPYGAAPQTRSFRPGPLKGEVLCLSGGSVGGDPLAFCGWADRSTIGVVMAREKTVPECADILRRMRADMEKRRD